MITPLLRLTPALDPERMATDHFYAADHAEEFEQSQWERQAEKIARIIYRQEERRERCGAI